MRMCGSLESICTDEYEKEPPVEVSFHEEEVNCPPKSVIFSFRLVAQKFNIHGV